MRRRTAKEPTVGDNPYTPPRTDAAPNTVDRPTGPMPGTVVAVIVLVSLFLLVELIAALANPVSAAIGIGISALILVGLVRRHALAWQWGMIMPILAALFTLVTFLGVLAGAPMVGAALLSLVFMFLILAVEISIPVLLTLRRSRLYFGLQCPECKSMKVKAASFLFTSMKCRACKHVWHR
jgi:hypothetical protein